MPVVYSCTTFLTYSQIAVPWKWKLPSAEAGDRFSWDVVSLFLFSEFLIKCGTYPEVYPKVYITYADFTEQWQNIYLDGDFALLLCEVLHLIYMGYSIFFLIGIKLLSIVITFSLQASM